jgi:hypothetical protein
MLAEWTQGCELCHAVEKTPFGPIAPIFAGASIRHRFRRSANAEREMRRAEQRII